MLIIPAPAGVIPDLGTVTVARKNYPRTRGGDPYDLDDVEKINVLSPHPRG